MKTETVVQNWLLTSRTCGSRSVVEEGSGKDFSLALQVSIERCRRTKKARVSSFELIPKLPYNILVKLCTWYNCPNALYFFQNVSRQGSTDLKHRRLSIANTAKKKALPRQQACRRGNWSKAGLNRTQIYHGKLLIVFVKASQCLL